VLLVIAHEGHVISSGGFHAVDPFAHIIGEFAAAALGGALLFAAVFVIRNRISWRGNP
jgi:hypothetical protein